MITKEQFEGLSPKARGYAVYMCGAREDEPNVPDEKNPFEAGRLTWKHNQAGGK